MKPPGWIAVDPKSSWVPSDDGRSVIVHVRVRWWHPGLWLELLKYRLGWKR